jgi:hypothetical protein
VTDFFYVLELTSEADHEGKGGRFNYSVADFRDAFDVLPPKAALLARRFEARCDWVCYTQFDKLASCLALIKKTEAEARFRYDFVVRQRPDMLLHGRFPPVWSLKRAVYAGVVPGGLGDMTYFAHRDFAEGVFGMVLSNDDDADDDVAQQEGHLKGDYWRRGELCELDRRFVRYMGDSGCFSACECWLKVSVRLQQRRATGVVLVDSWVPAYPVRLPKA